MKKFLRNNGLSLVLFALFLFTLFFQSVAGLKKHNQDQDEHGKPTETYLGYLKSDDFLEATAENWESEFLQLFTFVTPTRFLYQKGSPESHDPDSEEEEQQETPLEKRPWPVRHGGVVLKLYEHSLSLIFLLLFIVSFILHAIGGAGEYNQEHGEHGVADRARRGRTCSPHPSGSNRCRTGRASSSPSSPWSSSPSGSGKRLPRIQSRRRPPRPDRRLMPAHLPRLETR